jgi:hypothetical protein
MTIVQSTPERLVVQAGSLFGKTTMTFDKSAGSARIERSIALWKRKPTDLALAEIDHVDVVTMHDGASGADVHQTVLHTRSGQTIPVPVADEEAGLAAAQLRRFLGLT